MVNGHTRRIHFTIRTGEISGGSAVVVLFDSDRTLSSRLLHDSPAGSSVPLLDHCRNYLLPRPSIFS